MTPSQIARLRVVEREIILLEQRARLDDVRLAFLQDRLRELEASVWDRLRSGELFCYTALVTHAETITDHYVDYLATDTDDTPLAGVDVELHSPDLGSPMTGTTDAFGRYRFESVPAAMEDYFIRWSYGASTGDGATFDLDDNAARIEHTFDVSGFPTVSLDDEQEIGFDFHQVPLPGVEVFFFNIATFPGIPSLPGDAGDAMGSVGTDGDGLAEFCVDPATLNEFGSVRAAIVDVSSATQSDTMTAAAPTCTLVYDTTP